MLAPSDILADRVSFRLRSIDPPDARAADQFLCDGRGNKLASPARGSNASRPSRACRSWSSRAARKGGHRRRVLSTCRRARGVIFIGTAQERASSWWGRPTRDERGLDFGYTRRTVAVKHYHFYLRDGEWGRAFIKLCIALAGRAFRHLRVRPAARRAAVVRACHPHRA